MIITAYLELAVNLQLQYLHEIDNVVVDIEKNSELTKEIVGYYRWALQSTNNKYNNNKLVHNYC